MAGGNRFDSDGGKHNSPRVGDKILSLGHSPNFKLAVRPALVLLYGVKKDHKTTLGSKELQSALKQAGHKLEIVDDVAKLEMDLTSGKFDVALVDYGATRVAIAGTRQLPIQPAQ